MSRWNLTFLQTVQFCTYSPKEKNSQELDSRDKNVPPEKENKDGKPEKSIAFRSVSIGSLWRPLPSTAHLYQEDVSKRTSIDAAHISLIWVSGTDSSVHIVGLGILLIVAEERFPICPTEDRISSYDRRSFFLCTLTFLPQRVDSRNELQLQSRSRASGAGYVHWRTSGAWVAAGNICSSACQKVRSFTTGTCRHLPPS